MHDQKITASESSGQSPLLFPPSKASVHMLSNGITVILKADHAAPVVSLQAWCETGSIHEGDWLGAGISHFLEHMIFKGTERRSTADIPQDVQAAGGSMNAYTSFDRTVYYIDGPSDQWKPCLDVLTDIVTKAAVPEEEFAQEQEVIRREIAMGNDDPDSTLSELLFSTAFVSHPCKYPVIGHRRLFDRVSRDALYQYYKNRYSPENLFFVVAGDIEGDDILTFLEQSAGKLQAQPFQDPALPVEPRQTGRRVVHRPFATAVTSMGMAWRIPTLDHPDSPALDILASILGEGRSSRLYREIREEKKLVHGIDAYSYAPKFAGVFVISAECEPENRDPTIDAVVDLVRDVQDAGVTEEDMQKACSRILATQFSTLSTVSGQASDLGSNWHETRNLDFTRDYLQALQDVSPDDVREVARKYLVDSGLSIVSLNPMADEAGPSPSAPTITSSKKSEIQKTELANGLTLLVHENRKTPLVSIASTFRAGLPGETRETNGISQLCARTLLKGTTALSADEISSRIESAGGSIRFSAGNNSMGIGARVLRPDLSNALEILSDVAMNASHPEDALNREREVQLASVRENARQPFPTAVRQLRESLFPDSSFGLSRFGSKESLPSITREAVKAFREQHFGGKNGVITVFGDVDAVEVSDEVAARFGGLPVGESRYREVSPIPPLRENSVLETRLAEKEQAVITIGFRTCALDHADTDALEVIDEACSDMASRLFARIREELGLAYYVGTSQFPGLHDGAFYFYVGTDPARANEAEKELIGQIESLVTEGVPEDELARVKAAYRGKTLLELQSNGAYAQTTGLDELFGLGFDHYQKSLATIESLEAESVRSVCEKYFAAPHVISRVLPE
ncbi:MAG: pitrilysin family protein [Verrucomicrobiota bacterium]